MIGGWFVGGFTPSALSTTACEVAVKRFKKGDVEQAHFHKIATEVTLVLEGRVRMLGEEWSAEDIVVIAPNKVTAFEALEDSTLVVVKMPGALSDKYLADIALPEGTTE